MVSASKSSGGSGPIRLGMVGGGQGAFIGGVHRIASRLDGEFVRRRRRFVVRSRARKGIGGRTRARPCAILRLVSGNGEGGSGARRRH